MGFSNTNHLDRKGKAYDEALEEEYKRMLKEKRARQSIANALVSSIYKHLSNF